MENSLKQEMIDLGNEFVEFWRRFSETIEKVSSDNTGKLAAAWHEHFVNNPEVISKLTEVKLKIEEIEFFSE